MQASPRVPGGAAEVEQDVRQRDAPPLVGTLILRRRMFQNQKHFSMLLSGCASSHASAVCTPYADAV